MTAAPGDDAARAREAEAAARVVRGFLGRDLPGVKVETKDSFVRPVFPLPAKLPLVSLIIPTRDRLELLRPCLESVLHQTDYPSFEVLVIDNDSSDPATLAYLSGLGAPVRGTDPSPRSG